MDNHHHIPSKWRKDTNDLANAVGFHSTLGVAAAEADALRDAYVWFDQKTGAKHTLTAAKRLEGTSRQDGVRRIAARKTGGSKKWLINSQIGLTMLS